MRKNERERFLHGKSGKPEGGGGKSPRRPKNTKNIFQPGRKQKIIFVEKKLFGYLVPA